MRRIFPFILAMMVLLALLTLPGCRPNTPPPPPPGPTLPNVSPNQTLTVKKGERFTIALDTSADYNWTFAKPYDKTRLKIVAISTQTSGLLKPSSSQREIWTFQALQPGKTDITLQYARREEKGKPERVETYHIVIQ